MRHKAVPETLTPENLAQWIKLNKVDVFNHIDQIPLTEEEINHLAMESSLASRAMDKLHGVETYFKEVIKMGTPYDSDKEQYQPISVTIPPSKGMKKLEANREHADHQLDSGYKEETTHLYLIPYPEDSMMIMVDIEGEQWSQYSRKMTMSEVNQHKPLLRTVGQKFHDDLAKDGMFVESVDKETNTIVIAADKTKKSRKPEDPFI